MQTKRLTPKETAHAWCHYCLEDRRDSEVENCGGQLVYATGKPCVFYPYRNGRKRVPPKVFKQFCLECQGGNRVFVEECSTEDCMIHPLRFGKNPSIKGSDRERMASIRPPGSTFSPAKTVQNRFSGSG